jgi:ornithine cyclodeaminase/alanine dehydrogenase-like protein (mu-crystallin family)
VPVPHFDAEATGAATPWPRLIAAIRDGFQRPHVAPDRHIHAIAVPGTEAATALLMPAWIEGDIYGVKLANIFPGNGALGLPSIASLYVAFDGSTGALRATIDGGTLTVRRTAATSALASTYLSRPDSSTLLVLGAGRMAPMLIAAHRTVRPITRTLVWARDAAKAAALAKAEGAEVATDLAAAVAVADIVSAATLATAPLIEGQWLQPGTHVDLVGAYSPGRREADAEAVGRASVFIDTEGGAKAEAGDLIQALAEGRFAWRDVKADLSMLVRGAHRGRADAAEITLFKSVGAAIEDLAAARLVLASAGTEDSKWPS